MTTLNRRDFLGLTATAGLALVTGNLGLPKLLAQQPAAAVPKAPPVAFRFKTKDGLYQFTIDTRGTPPEMAAWAREKLVPLLNEWYPRIVKFLPSTSKGFSAPREVSIDFKLNDKYHGAKTYYSDNRIACNIQWFNDKQKRNGYIIHELVHIVQQHGRGGREGGSYSWLTEGIAEYVRGYLYEPSSRGDLVLPAYASRSRYNDSYIGTASFLHWVAGTYDKDIVPKLNDLFRQGKYSDKLWEQCTGHTAQELEAGWKAYLVNPKRGVLKHSDAELRAAILDQAKPGKAK